MRNFIYPSYYKTFQCTADKCPDTCCRGWNIEIDDAVYVKWKAMPQADCCLLHHMHTGRFGKNAVRHTIAMDETLHCPLLTENGLCQIVLRYGDEMIPKICREFPRQEVDQENLVQKSVAIRCPAVLDLLWESDHFSYETEGNVNETVYPAKPLLDLFLEYGHGSKDLTSATLLRNLFLALLQTHRTLVAEVPVDENGYREYGQELLTKENIKMVEKALELIRQEKGTALSSYCGNYHLRPELRTCHDLMYELMREFFDSPVFGKEFHQLFYQSQELLRLPEKMQWQLYEAAKPSPDTEEKLKLVILEELFNSVLTVEVMDYETILARLQWLIVQYLAIRYILYLDVQAKKDFGEGEDFALLRHRILNIFRVTDLPDIIKISFFDTKFINWMWKEDSPEIELLKY